MVISLSSDPVPEPAIIAGSADGSRFRLFIPHAHKNVREIAAAFVVRLL